MTVSRYDEDIRRIIISGDIREDTAAKFLESLTAFERVDMAAAVTVYVDTYGGNLRAALAMYDAMRICACPIETVGIGKVMSAGALILAAGDKGHRYLAPHTGVMIHQVSGGVYGTVNEMDLVMQETKRMQDLYIELLSKHTGKAKSKIAKDIMIDNYMDSKAAIEYGLADKIVPYRKTTKTTKSKKNSK